MKYGSAVVAGSLLAGCVDRGSDPRRTATEPATNATSDGAYAVTMEPTGTVAFDRVSEVIAGCDPTYIDMLVALGHGDAVESIRTRRQYLTTHYDELDGVSIDSSSLTQLASKNGGVSKEVFYEMDADLHLMDPHWLTRILDSWSNADVEEIAEGVAPFLGNVIFRRTDPWHDYRYYTLYEAFEKVAAVVRERERFEAIRSIHEETVAAIEAELPAADQRPDALLLYAPDDPEEFYPYRLSGKGANKEHFHTLGIADAFADTDVSGFSTSDSGSIDYETLLEIDPDSLLLRYRGKARTREAFEELIVSHIRDHEVGSQLSAVENDQVFRGGPIFCGPLHNLFMLERYAGLYYPDRFADGHIFDRDRLANVITGR
ncbi:iron complex transport system substrate-binding protein [Halarchaeum solikamskense]|uniref:ABC transporter substrate-binding protein n=1 Tax=Halarchaeum nitratireducens TaxID=489913 RepID=UPI001FD8786E|nr:ABC transporter substrate-binding protein [Halarchaeum solikamskense]MBP2251083.1 iron complex transport system substrate-binding protein [Halarchaeum solikamskense]